MAEGKSTVESRMEQRESSRAASDPIDMTGAKIGETRPDNDASTLHTFAAVARVRHFVGVISGKKRTQYYPALSEGGVH